MPNVRCTRQRDDVRRLWESNLPQPIAIVTLAQVAPAKIFALSIRPEKNLEDGFLTHFYERWV